MICDQLLKNLSILLVEDEQHLARLLKKAIGARFKKFTLASDGREGLKATRLHKPDLVITDITMPNMDGLEMSARLHEEHPSLPIVVLSAYSEKEHLLQAIDIGVTKYLIKPFDPDELLDVLCQLARKMDQIHYIPLMPPFRFDPDHLKLFRNHKMLHLSHRENLFISQLLASPNHFLSAESIKSLLWDDTDISDERLRVFINRLRQKTDHRLIENIVGQGYLLRTHSLQENP